MEDVVQIKILIGQPKHENELSQLINEIKRNPNVDIVVFPEGYFKQEKIEEVCQIAKNYNTYIISGYKDLNNKDRAFIVNRLGNIILERAKTPEDKKLYAPSKVEDNGLKLGYLLCREVFWGSDGLDKEEVDLILNPIGVGMFSEEQFQEWTNEARKIAVEQGVYIIGTSHADGSYKNCGFSIPIAYCFDANGEGILISKDDVSTRILDFEVKENQLIYSQQR
jgi:predicted amidohydrolase